MLLLSFVLPCNFGIHCTPRSPTNRAFWLINDDFLDGIIKVIEESNITDWRYRSWDYYFLKHRIRIPKESVVFNSCYTRRNRILSDGFWWRIVYQSWKILIEEYTIFCRIVLIIFVNQYFFEVVAVSESIWFDISYTFRDSYCRYSIVIAKSTFPNCNKIFSEVLLNSVILLGTHKVPAKWHFLEQYMKSHLSLQDNRWAWTWAC